MTSVEKLILAFKSLGVVTAGDLAEAIGYHRTRGWVWSRSGGEAGYRDVGEIPEKARMKFSKFAESKGITLKKGVFKND